MASRDGLGYQTAELRFYASLADFMPAGHCTVERPFDVAPRCRPAPTTLSGSLLQCAEVLRHFEVEEDSLAPFSSCAECNGRSASAPAAAVAGDVPETIFAIHHRSARCQSCGCVYWEGSHVAEPSETVAAIRLLAGLA